jgi:hypothetical protein
MPIIWATLICVTLAFLVWTALQVLRRNVGRDMLVAAFLKPAGVPAGDAHQP